MWEFAGLFGAIACVNMVFHEKGDFNAVFFSFKTFVFSCEMYATSVQIERTCKDLSKAYLEYKTEDIAHCFSMKKLFERIQI